MSPAQSERSKLHHHVQELEAQIKALQESKPEPVSVVRPPSAGPLASATSAAPKESIPIQRRSAIEDTVHEVPEVVPPPALPAPLQSYDDYNNLIFENTSFIPLTMTIVRDHEAPGVRESPGDPPSSSSSSTSSSSSSTCRVQNPYIPRAARVVAHGGAAGRVRAGLFASRTVRLGERILPRTLQSIEDTSPERPPRSTNKRNPM